MADAEEAKPTLKIESDVLHVSIPLKMKHGKILAKGLLLDAINVVDEYFFILKQKQLHDATAMAASQKRVIDKIIHPNGRSNGV